MIVGVSNGAAEEDWCWDLNPGAAAILRRGSHRGFWGRRERGSCSFVGGEEKGPRSFGGEGKEDHSALVQ